MNMSRKAPVQLHPDDEAYVALKVETGQYENVDAVVQAAIQALKERDEAFEEMLRREALPALDRLLANPASGRTSEQVMARIRAHHDRLTGGK